MQVSRTARPGNYWMKLRGSHATAWRSRVKLKAVMRSLASPHASPSAVGRAVW